MEPLTYNTAGELEILPSPPLLKMTLIFLLENGKLKTGN